MKIQYASDLHLEFPSNASYLEKHPLNPLGEVLVLAGDIVPYAVLNKFDYFFDGLSEKFKAVYWIPGNHEYYYSDINVRSGSLIENIRSNIFLLNNQTIDLGICKLLCTTLWSKISPLTQWKIQHDMSDFHLIKNKDQHLDASTYNTNHEMAKNYLLLELAKKDIKPVVVVSHHVPTFKNYPIEHINSPLKEGFATELYKEIEAYQPTYWIFGHHHSNVDEFTIGTTSLITNQLGYVDRGEGTGFSIGKTIEISIIS